MELSRCWNETNFREILFYKFLFMDTLRIYDIINQWNLYVWKIADFIFRLFAENSYLLFTTGLILYIDHLVQTFGLTFGRPVQYYWHVYRIFLIRKGLIWLHDMGDQVSKKARPLKADWVGKTRVIKRCELKLYFLIKEFFSSIPFRIRFTLFFCVGGTNSVQVSRSIEYPVPFPFREF